jgi:hypothetical protein
MRDQYAGDISDYLKYAFLREVVPDNWILGVAWYYVPNNDGKPDGGRVGYLSEDEWSALDLGLYRELRFLSERTVAAVECLPIWPAGTIFHRDPVETNRAEWTKNMLNVLSSAGIVFMDPDNGLAQGNVTERHATRNEVIALALTERPITLIRFPSRDGKHPEQLARYHNLLSKFSPITVRSTVMLPNVAGCMV